MEDTRRKAIEEISEEINSTTSFTKKQLQKWKNVACKKYKISDIIHNAELIEVLKKQGNLAAVKALRTRATRFLSGVAVLAIMTKPAGCPGKCIYCAGGVTSAKSYTGFEPAARRGEQNDWSSFRQTVTRLNQLKAIGHDPQKCEVIIMGGTFNSFPKEYQVDFMKGIFDACNETISATLEEAQKKNESALHRVIGVTFETRPDWCGKADVENFLSLGCTRMELGVQTLDDKTYEKIQRGHGTKEVREATYECKEHFLKVCHHFMPGLFSTAKRDVQMFEKLFADDAYKPDMLKIYPCLVMPNTPLYELYKRGEFVPYNAETAAKVIAQCMKFIPEYCRVMRVDRDIPTNLIAGGVEKSNLRQLVEWEMERLKIKGRDIRAREIGLAARKGAVQDATKAEIKRIDYNASKGQEVFLSMEDDGGLYGFIRLRKPAGFEDETNSITFNTAGIRELHVYGEQTPIGVKGENAQHRKIGSVLLKEAERVAYEEFDAKRMLIISGIGVRNYYRKFGYEQDSYYMGKKF